MVQQICQQVARRRMNIKSLSRLFWRELFLPFAKELLLPFLIALLVFWLAYALLPH